MIRSFVKERDQDSLIADLGSGAADIASIVSEVRARFPELTEPPTLDPEQARFRLFDSVSNFIVNAAGREPLAIALEDLHVADKPSLLLLQFLATRLADAPVLLHCTYREDELERNDELSETLGLLSRERGYQRIRLGGLTEREVKALLENVSQQQLEGRDQLALLRAVHGESEGNPVLHRGDPPPPRRVGSHLSHRRRRLDERRDHDPRPRDSERDPGRDRPPPRAPRRGSQGACSRSPRFSAASSGSSNW